jgi:hypothetical protein
MGQGWVGLVNDWLMEPVVNDGGSKAASRRGGKKKNAR